MKGSHIHIADPATSDRDPSSTQRQNPDEGGRRRLGFPDRDALRVGIPLALLKVALHLAFHSRYGVFRDELYFLACADHPSFGYVDQPPLIAWLGILVQAAIRATEGIAGAPDALFFIRLLPALAGGALVYLTTRLARRLGGGLFAQALAGACVLAAPVFLVVGHLFTMNVFDQLLWLAACHLLVLIAQEEGRRAWLLLGVVIGIGGLTKLTILFFGLGLLVALALTPARDANGPLSRAAFRQRDFRHAALLAFAIASPYLLWQLVHGWPTLEFFRHYASHKAFPVTPVSFLSQQVLTMHPNSLPIWLCGLGGLAFVRGWRPYRPLAWIYLFCLGLLLALRTKFYLLSPMYPALLAAGAAFLAQRLEGLGPARARPLRAGILGIVALGALPVLPEALPILPVETYLEHAPTRQFARKVRTERRELAGLPQQFADMHGWEELAQAVARVRDGLPPAEREGAVIIAGNYGQAGAIDFHGRRLGLPRAMSGHNGYWFWPLREPSERERLRKARVAISVGVDYSRLSRVFKDNLLVARTRCEHCMPDENGVPIFVSREPLRPLDEAWAAFRHFD